VTLSTATAEWARTCLDDATFWASTPTWCAGTALRDLDGHLVGCGPKGLVVVPPPASVIARFFDGTGDLAELAEDLAAASNAPLAEARWLAATTALDLHGFGLVDGVQATDPPGDASTDTIVSGSAAPPIGGTLADPTSPRVSNRIDPESGVEVRVEEHVDADGNDVTTVHLPDGSRRVTVAHTYHHGGAEGAADDATRLAEGLMGGRRSLAELVPAGTCLGQKLRIGEEPDLVEVVCVDGVVRGVRCHDPAIADLLSQRAGDHLAPRGAQGPVEAFVVTPFEGDGPRRVYDGRGERRGRPRTDEQVVELVDRLLGEAVLRDGTSPGGGILLAAHLVQRGDEGMLVHRAVVSDPRAIHDLRADGWDLTGGAAVLFEDRTIGWATAWGIGRRQSLHRVRTGPVLGGMRPATMLGHLVAPGPLLADLDDVADRLVDLVSQVRPLARTTAAR
jgi:hypothetical protein